VPWGRAGNGFNRAQRGTLYAVTQRRRDVDKLHEEIEELFADLWQVPRFSGMRRGFRPNVDCYHTDDPHELVVVVELAGADPASVRIEAADRALVVKGERLRPKTVGHVYQQVEIEYGSFERRIRLAEDVDPDRAHARYDRGILTITLPVAEKAAASGRIAIEVERT
jgi:HSP20 family protein